MNRPTAASAGLFVLLVVSVTAGCGTERAVDDTAASASASYEAQRKAAERKHDRLFRDVAAVCSDRVTTASPSTAAPEPTDPEARKYAENHAYKQLRPLQGAALCRGQAHAKRITAALEAVHSEADLRSKLTALGYPESTVEVYRTGGSLGFTFSVPEAGPCITGLLTSPVKVEAHGHYMEVGCMEPRGGH
ncbi:hypothetical protein OG905_22340 [Streptomyces sp. NBC_00322]|uniref:hypothetical protein n=1 Tax=Streptomyces sp. NBC_00322 TaxID=2975712 RepID=UPI002E28AF2F|nr:hypothetical protein [Streptomyces sp. NBC_00322]